MPAFCRRPASPARGRQPRRRRTARDRRGLPRAPVVALPGYSRPLIRAEQYLELVEEHTTATTGSGRRMQHEPQKDRRAWLVPGSRPEKRRMAASVTASCTGSAAARAPRVTQARSRPGARRWPERRGWSESLLRCACRIYESRPLWPRRLSEKRPAPRRAADGRAHRRHGSAPPHPLPAAGARPRRDWHARRRARATHVGRRRRTARPLARLGGRSEDRTTPVGSRAGSVVRGRLRACATR